jgi:hypothetical protein
MGTIHCAPTFYILWQGLDLLCPSFIVPNPLMKKSWKQANLIAYKEGLFF